MLVAPRAVPCATDRTARGYGENNTTSAKFADLPGGLQSTRLLLRNSGTALGRMRRVSRHGIMMLRAKASSKEVVLMSIFPTKILLATDGSEEARQAAQAAA